MRTNRVEREKNFLYILLLYFTECSPVSSFFYCAELTTEGKNPRRECGLLSAAEGNVSRLTILFVGNKVFLTVPSKPRIFCPDFYGRIQNFVVILLVLLLDLATILSRLDKEEQAGLVEMWMLCSLNVSKSITASKCCSNQCVNYYYYYMFFLCYPKRGEQRK